MNTKKSNYLLLLFIFTIVSCNNDSLTEETFLCCGNNPFSSLNINNLISSSPKVRIPNVFTPNSDGLNDTFILPFIDSYPNYNITIYDLNESVVFESNNNIFFNGKDQNKNEDLKFGSYKYKIVIENEQTFLQYGYLCLVRNKSEINGFDFSNCDPPQSLPEVDPVLVN